MSIRIHLSVSVHLPAYLPDVCLSVCPFVRLSVPPALLRLTARVVGHGSPCDGDVVMTLDVGLHGYVVLHLYLHLTQPPTLRLNVQLSAHRHLKV